MHSEKKKKDKNIKQYARGQTFFFRDTVPNNFITMEGACEKWT